MQVDPPLLVAVTGAVLGVATWATNIRAMRNTQRQQDGATALSARAQALTEHESLNARLREENDRLRADRAADEQRRQDDRRRLAARCAAATAPLVDALRTLQAVVVGQAAAVAAQDAIDDLRHHQAADHPDDPVSP